MQRVHWFLRLDSLPTDGMSPRVTRVCVRRAFDADIRDEYDVVFALPFCMIELLVVFHGSFVIVCFERLTNQTDRKTAL
jgi:hypothetical protein